MKIVAFMQNPWFPPGTSRKTIEAYRDDQAYHRKVLARCMSGKRLMHAFQDLYWEIYWDNANPEPADSSQGVMEPDISHILRVIETHEPDLILTFGRLPTLGVKDVMDANDIRIPLMACHHPNARGMTQYDLNQFAAKVMTRVSQCVLTLPA